MTEIVAARKLFVGVTGAQGVGKSTFCTRLADELTRISAVQVTLLNGLGEDIRRKGITVGSAARADAVAAIYCAHLARARAASNGIFIFDRCAVDALAYVRVLKNTGQVYARLYEEISWLMATQLDYVIHLQKQGIFEPINVTHETKEFRDEIAVEIPKIISDFNLKAAHVYAAEPGAVSEATYVLAELFGVRLAHDRV
ncbi:AAA family ATPase [Rhizobium leguminosarum]|uniref:AAA family ATPase n=1 Tax=Rhizobium leguminosarum TaxID=384 RepID=UPI0003788E5A|nr:AAA family ATPase [Rhizobium leguminosarum]